MDNIIIMRLGFIVYSILMWEGSKGFNEFHFEHSTFDNPSLSDLRFVKQDAWYGGQGAVPMDSAIWLNPDPRQVQTRAESNIGKVVYKNPVQFKSPHYPGMASFSSSFSFQITTTRAYPDCGSGMVFFIAEHDKAPEKSYGRYFGMVSPTALDASRFFAIEFDTHQSATFEDVSASHIGIDINSLKSLAVADTSPNSTNPEFYPRLFLYNNNIFTAWVDYNFSANLIHVWMTNSSTSQRPSTPCLTLSHNLSDVFKDYMYVGFSATNNASEDGMEGHAIYSWSFSTYYSLREKRRGSISPLTRALIIAGAAIVCVVGCLLVYYFLCRRRFKRRKLDGGSTVLPHNTPNISGNADIAPTSIPQYTYKQLKKATGSFTDENRIGEGGYSIVYKAVLEDGSTVAVKKLKEGLRQEAEFLSELKIISNTRHRNLLQLQGWCYEKGGAILVYKYMRKGSLDSYLYGKNRGLLIQRDTRFRILAGVASALEYMHFGLPDCVLHRDVKAANVLLTDEYEPMLGDFGLARLISHSREAKTMTAAGTAGYMAPEVAFSGKFSDKADVYAYGVLALEVACGRPAIDQYQLNPEEVRLVEWVWSLHLKNQLIDALDSSIRYDISSSQEQQWRGVLHVALMCCNNSPDSRPSMRQVSQTLQGDDVLLSQPLPKTRAYIPPPLENWPSASGSSASVH